MSTDQSGSPFENFVATETVDHVTVTGTLPGTSWRPQGGIAIAGDVQLLGRDQARALAGALERVADLMDAAADDRYGQIGGEGV